MKAKNTAELRYNTDRVSSFHYIQHQYVNGASCQQSTDACGGYFEYLTYEGRLTNKELLSVHSAA
jgi:hypothetical protein